MICLIEIGPTVSQIDRSCQFGHVGFHIVFKISCSSTSSSQTCWDVCGFWCSNVFYLCRSHLPLPVPTTMTTSLVGTIIVWFVPQSPMLPPESKRVYPCRSLDPNHSALSTSLEAQHFICLSSSHVLTALFLKKWGCIIKANNKCFLIIKRPKLFFWQKGYVKKQKAPARNALAWST